MANDRRQPRDCASEALFSSPITRQLNSLVVGDAVQLQNQTGNHPTKWHNTDVITEVLPHRQYCVVVDGSRRMTLRNRKFLKHIDPFCCNIDTVLIANIGNTRPTQNVNERSPNDTTLVTHNLSIPGNVPLVSELSTPLASPLTQPSITQISDDCPTTARTSKDPDNNLATVTPQANTVVIHTV